LEAQAIIVDQVIIPQHHITTEEHHMSGLVSLQIGFDDDDNIQHLGKLLREHGDPGGNQKNHLARIIHKKAQTSCKSLIE
jgi:hypothetical protein